MVKPVRDPGAVAKEMTTKAALARLFRPIRARQNYFQAGRETARRVDKKRCTWNRIERGKRHKHARNGAPPKTFLSPLVDVCATPVMNVSSGQSCVSRIFAAGIFSFRTPRSPRSFPSRTTSGPFFFFFSLKTGLCPLLYRWSSVAAQAKPATRLWSSNGFRKRNAETNRAYSNR